MFRSHRVFNIKMIPLSPLMVTRGMDGTWPERQREEEVSKMNLGEGSDISDQNHPKLLGSLMGY